MWQPRKAKQSGCAYRLGLVWLKKKKLTRTRYIVIQWKEHSGDLIWSFANIWEDRVRRLKRKMSHTMAEVVKIVEKLASRSVPVVDEIHTEMLKTLDIVRLSWLTHIFKVAWRTGTTAEEQKARVVVPTFVNGDQKVSSNYQGLTLFSTHGKLYPVPVQIP